MPPLTMVRALVAAVIAAALFGAGWTVNGWRWSERLATEHAALSAATVTASEAAREREQVLADAIAAIDADRTTERTKANDENARLRAAVDAGAVRLHVAAHCPTAGLPDSAAGPGLDYRAGAELDAAARAAYFGLRDGLKRSEAKLSACQDVIRNERVHAND